MLHLAELTMGIIQFDTVHRTYIVQKGGGHMLFKTDPPSKAKHVISHYHSRRVAAGISYRNGNQFLSHTGGDADEK